jgi:hypothetical protein
MTWFKCAFISHAFSQYGDALTTTLCFYYAASTEGNPLVAALMAHAGIPGLIALKVLFSILPLTLLRASEITRNRLSKSIFTASLLTWAAVVNNAEILLFHHK